MQALTFFFTTPAGRGYIVGMFDVGTNDAGVLTSDHRHQTIDVAPNYVAQLHHEVIFKCACRGNLLVFFVV